MKKLIKNLLGLNLIAFFLFNPGIVLAQTSQNLNNPLAEEKENKADKSNNTSFSATKGNCFEFIALSLVYLPKELKNKLASECKKTMNKKMANDSEKILQKSPQKVLKTDILAKTSFVSDYIYQTPYDPIYHKAEEKFGVPWQILSVIHEIESNRSGDTYLTSYAGAVGPMQFLPSTFAVYGVDGNNDGIADISNVEDAIFSAANYLAANGGASGNLNNALFRYNNDYWYVNLVLYKAGSLGLDV
ncbi:MAG: lytic transglycosylase domain-containing protein [Patescibacteria group bacterium]